MHEKSLMVHEKEKIAYTLFFFEDNRMRRSISLKTNMVGFHLKKKSSNEANTPCFSGVKYNMAKQRNAQSVAYL